MKILMVQQFEGIAGAERYWLETLPELARLGHQANLLLIGTPESIASSQNNLDELKEKGVIVHIIYSKRSYSLSGQFKIYRFFKQHQFDIVHTHLLAADLGIALSQKIFGSKVLQVSTKHGYEEKYNNDYGFNPSYKQKNFYWRAARFAESKIKRSFAISQGLYKLYSGLGIVKESNLDLINYGFDYHTEDMYNPELRFSNKQLILVGRLTEFKGHKFAFAALKLLKFKYPEVKLVVVGDGVLKKQLVSDVGNSGLEEQVIFTGSQPNPREYMSNSDVVLVPSVSEGFGVVLLEAFSVKRPVVAFNVPSPSELIVHNHDGLLAEPYSIEEYASLIESILINPMLGKKLSDNAYEKLNKKFTKRRMVDETVEFYERVLNDVS